MSPRMHFAAMAFLAFVFVVTGAQALARSARLHALADRPKPPPIPCVGEAITVDEDYGGGPIQEWSCRGKCKTGKRFYLMYRNGYATQCGEPPDCFDEGEDNGSTCELSVQSTE